MKRLLFILLLLFIFGCEINSNLIKEVEEKKIIENDDKNIEVYFCPTDDCEGTLVDFINSANKSVYCALFDLKLTSVISALSNKNEIIDVKVVVDDNNYEMVENLSFVIKDNTNQLSHNKFCVVDNIKISSGSFNPTERGAYYNNNNLVIINSEYLAKNYLDEFEELWEGTYGDGEKVRRPIIYYNNIKIENYFCPEDNCGDRIGDVLSYANQTIYFMTFSFTHDRIGKILALKNYEGKEIKGVFEIKNLKDSEYELLKYQGLDVKTDNNPYNMHHKVFIIDEKIVVTGSFNPTGSGDNKNDENVLIIHDKNIAKMFIEEFWNVWNYSDELVEEIRNSTSLVISEVYYDAPGKDEGKEYVKLYNPTEEKIKIDYWRLSDGKNMEVLQGEIKPDESILIYPKFSLKNSEGLIILKDKSLKQIDYVAYEGLWNIKAESSEKIVRINFEKINSEEEWIVTKVI